MHSYKVTFEMLSTTAWDTDALGDAVRAWVAHATTDDSTVGVGQVKDVKVKDNGMVETEADDELPPRERRKAIVEENERDARAAAGAEEDE